MIDMFAVCPGCGITFKKKNKIHTYCTRECKYKHTFVSQAVREQRKCVHCGKEFISNNAKQVFCSRKCEKDHREDRHPDWIRRGNSFASEEGYIKRIQARYSRLDYAGGWENEQAYFVCNDCGHVFKRKTESLKPSSKKRIACPYCSDILSQIHTREKQDQKAKEKYLKALDKKVVKIASFSQLSFLTCKVCGIPFVPSRKNRQCCSNNCAQALRWKMRDAYRYIIPLEELAQRDNDTCQICGKKVDWNDYKVDENGYTVYGNMYPSRDHIIEKSKGGSHTWQNMQLAHRICNTKRWTQKNKKTS